MKQRIIAATLASLLTAGAAALALTPSGAAAQEGGTTFLLVPQYGPPGPGQPVPFDLDRYGRELFERGYWLGRYEEQLRRAQGQALAARGGGPERPGMVDLPPRYREPGVTTFDRPGQFDVFRAPPPEGLDPQQIRRTLREARQALRQGEAQRAEQALARLDQMLGGGEQQRLQQALEEAEQALRRNDQQAAEEAIRRARQAVSGQEEQAGAIERAGEGQEGEAEPGQAATTQEQGG